MENDARSRIRKQFAVMNFPSRITDSRKGVDVFAPALLREDPELLPDEVDHAPWTDGLPSDDRPMPGYVCPDCKAPLTRLYCRACDRAYACRDGVPCLLSGDPKFERTAAIVDAYDAIYASQTNVWENQGRTPEFIRYFGALLDRFPGDRLLEIGCGEGFLLAALRDRNKPAKDLFTGLADDSFNPRRGNREMVAIDLSLAAIGKAQTRTQAHFSLALSERLPFPDEHFDLVTSVAVMEHFLDIKEALREIRRVLKPHGYYASLTHVELSLAERVAAKFSEYVFPRPRPVHFARLILEKFRSSLVQQPIQNRYTAAGAQLRLAEAGFRIRDVIRRRHPDQPPIGPNVAIYIAQK
jgi:ubiquinone/menaquinone biosynthesis C-methylase UbiE